MPLDIPVNCASSSQTTRLRKPFNGLQQQIALLNLADHPAIRTIAQPLTVSAPYSFALQLPEGVDPLNDRLRNQSNRLDDQANLSVAAQILSATAAAHRVGLYHGSFAPSTILVDRRKPNVRAYLDFSATSFDDENELSALTLETDLETLRNLFRNLLNPVVDSQADSNIDDRLSGRQRAVLRKWLSDDNQLPPTVGQWQTILRPFGTEPAQPSQPAVDHTGIVVVEQAPATDGSTCELPGGSTHPARGAAAIPNSLGRFQILKKIGEGGMGAVFRATDPVNGQTVALKVLHQYGTDMAQSIRRFRKEARLLADAQNDHVTRMIEIGEDVGFHFLAMEFIDGIDLKQWLHGRGALPESEALAIAADLARALVEAHAREVVHRDLKPENVLLQLRTDAVPSELPVAERPIGDFILKLTDFGIARHVSQSESLEVTLAGTILGTPKYMSPEQCKSSDKIGPAADVYSLGITLFQLLTGNVPFDSNDVMKLAAMHCFDSPPSIQKRVAEVSDLTTRIVDRALSKSPADRYGDAAQMLAALLQTIRGDASDMEAHPRLPQHIARKFWEKTVAWDLASDPHELWPLVSNTDRINEAMGLPAAEYRTEKSAELGIRKFGSFTLGGVKISWEEHPFEWIEGQRMAVLREFDCGPFKWFMSVTTLVPQSGGGTQLSHQVCIEPRNLIGRVLTKVEADWKGFKNLNRVYERMDRSIQARRNGSKSIDPFTAPKSSSKKSRQRIDERIDSIVRGGTTPESAEALRTVLTDWAAQEKRKRFVFWRQRSSMSMNCIKRSVMRKPIPSSIATTSYWKNR